MSIEEQMADLAENAMMHETVTTLLRGRFDGLRKAIAGRL
jgi:flagellar basal body rod protein FlgB